VANSRAQSRCANAVRYGEPPSTRTSVPVVKLADGLARNSAAPTISFGSPPRFIASRGAWNLRNASMSHAFEMSVRNGPATMQFTRTFGPYANANERVIELSPAFAAPYGSDVGDGFNDAVLEILMIEPPSPFAMRLPTSADNRNGPLKLSPTTLSKRSSV